MFARKLQKTVNFLVQDPSALSAENGSVSVQLSRGENPTLRFRAPVKNYLSRARINEAQALSRQNNPNLSTRLCVGCSVYQIPPTAPAVQIY